MVFLRPAYKQPNAWTCGPAVARIILHSFGRKKTLREISKELSTTRAGTANKDLKRVFKRHGLSFTEKEDATIKDLKTKLKTHWIIIAYWIPKHKEAHYSIVRRVTSKRVYFHDTWFGSNHSYSTKHFMKYWWDDEATRWFLAVKKPTSFASRILKPIFRWVS